MTEINKIIRFAELKVSSAEENVRMREGNLRVAKEGLADEEAKLETLLHLMMKVQEMEDMMKVREMEEDPDRDFYLNREVMETAQEAVRKMTIYMDEVRQNIESQEALLIRDKEELAFRNLELELVRLAVAELKIH